MKKQLIALALSTALLAGSSAAIAPEEACLLYTSPSPRD